MRGGLIRIVVVLAVAAVAVALVATRDGRGDASTTTLGTRTQQAGAVDVEATLRRVDDAGAAATLEFDTHAVELDLDVAAAAMLSVGGTTWPTEAWDGDGPGGHHREGELRFAAGGSPDGEAVLTITGLSEPVTFRWQLPVR